MLRILGQYRFQFLVYQISSDGCFSLPDPVGSLSQNLTRASTALFFGININHHCINLITYVEISNTISILVFGISNFQRWMFFSARPCIILTLTHQPRILTLSPSVLLPDTYHIKRCIPRIVGITFLYGESQFFQDDPI